MTAVQSLHPTDLSPSGEANGAQPPSLDAILRGDEAAWRAFVATYDPPLRVVVRHAAEATHPLAEDEIDDVLGDFWLAAIADDKRMLRAFNPRRGAPLMTWLTFHVARIAHERTSKRARRPEHVGLSHARNIADPRPLPTGRPFSEGASLDSALRECVRTTVVEVMREERAAADQTRRDDEAERPRPAAWWAEQLGCSAESLIKRAKRGSLESVKIGARYYFTRSQIDGSRRWRRA